MTDRPKNSRLDFRCCKCGKPACYGENVRLLEGELGTWYCRADVPAGFLPGTSRALPPLMPIVRATGAQGVLL